MVYCLMANNQPTNRFIPTYVVIYLYICSMYICMGWEGLLHFLETTTMLSSKESNMHPPFHMKVGFFSMKKQWPERPNSVRKFSFLFLI